jgi:bisphosphoglycerate-dependent phosphoglycerate mutase
MTKILLTRHGHVEGIHPPRFRGREPLELTARGREQAAAVAARIAGAWRPVKIYTSPMGRCMSAYWRIAQEPCCLNEIDIGGGKVCIVRINETHHLDALGPSP